MLVKEYRKAREELRMRRRSIDADISSHREDMLAALSLTRRNEDLQGDYVVSLAIGLNELLLELKGVDDQIGILSRELDD